MTGFGRGSATTHDFVANAEISSVNRKQAEVVIQGSKELAPFEPAIRKAVLTRVSRGRVQVAIQLDSSSSEVAAVRIDVPLARALERSFAELSKTLGREIQPTAGDFLRVPGLLQSAESVPINGDAWSAIEPALESALEQFLQARSREGAELGRDLETRITGLQTHRQAIGERAPTRPGHYREALLKRLRDAGLELELDDERVVREIALFADRCDVSEELTRLDAHLEAFRGYMASDEAVGRSLDFLCQEIHREFNTIGSKANDAAIAHHVVAAKTELEKIREQVQNLE